MKTSGVVLSNGIKKYISEITLNPDIGNQCEPCALTIYFGETGEKIWDIAKRYRTTADAIKNENEISGDCIEKSGMLMIPSAK